MLRTTQLTAFCLFDKGIFEAPSLDATKIIKEGQIEKKGHSAAFMMWPR